MKRKKEKQENGHSLRAKGGKQSRRNRIRRKARHKNHMYHRKKMNVLSLSSTTSSCPEQQFVLQDFTFSIHRLTLTATPTSRSSNTTPLPCAVSSPLTSLLACPLPLTRFRFGGNFSGTWAHVAITGQDVCEYLDHRLPFACTQE